MPARRQLGCDLGQLAVALQPRQEQAMSTSIEQGVSAGGSTYRRRTPTLIRIIGRSIWRALEREGQLRAQRALRAAAARYETSDPALALQLREASQFDFDRRVEELP
jgi:hypothetical protein